MCAGSHTSMSAVNHVSAGCVQDHTLVWVQSIMWVQDVCRITHSYECCQSCECATSLHYRRTTINYCTFGYSLLLTVSDELMCDVEPIIVLMSRCVVNLLKLLMWSAKSKCGDGLMRVMWSAVPKCGDGLMSLMCSAKSKCGGFMSVMCSTEPTCGVLTSVTCSTEPKCGGLMSVIAHQSYIGLSLNRGSCTESSRPCRPLLDHARCDTAPVVRC